MTARRDDAAAVRAVLGRVSRRLRMRRATRSLLRAFAIGAILVSAAMLARPLAPGLGAPPLLAALIVVPTLVMALAGARPIGARRAAAAADAAYGLGERLATAVEAMERRTPMEALLLRDAARRSAELDLARLPSPPLARDAWAAAAAGSLAAILALQPAAPLARAGGGGIVAAVTTRAEPSQPDGGRPPASAARVAVPASGSTLRQLLEIDPPAPTTITVRARDAAARVQGDPKTVRAEGDPRQAARESRGAETRLSSGSAQGAATSPGTLPQPAAEVSGGTDASETAGTATSVSASTLEARGGAGAVPDASSPATGEPRRPGTQALSIAASRAAVARSPLPPALRAYVVRYFELLERIGDGRGGSSR